MAIQLILPSYFAPPDLGLLIPRTKDGRVLFLLPWEGHVIAGTTDHPADVCIYPRIFAYPLRAIYLHFFALSCLSPEICP